MLIDALVDAILKKHPEEAVGRIALAATDVGGTKRLNRMQDYFHHRYQVWPEIIHVDKARRSPTRVEVKAVTGWIEGRIVCIMDDEVATASTLANVAIRLKELGAKELWAAATHGVLCGEWRANLETAPLEALLLTDTIPAGPGKLHPRIRTVPIAEHLARIVDNIHWNNHFLDPLALADLNVRQA